MKEIDNLELGKVYELLYKIKQLTNTIPNDQELETKVRELINNIK